MKIAIIGGSGRMGRWFASFLSKEGKEVIITGRNQKKLQEAKQQLGVAVATNVEAVKWADIILLSVPVDNFEETVKQISPYTHPKQIIIDITSVKVAPVEIMHRYIEAGLILGAHPVFGPGAQNMTNQNFVLTPVNQEETHLAQRVKQYLELRGATVTLMSPHEHDEMMAVILGLSHFIAIVSADSLANFGKLREMEAVSSNTYKVLLTLIGSVISEDPELYASLQMSFPNLTKIEDLFQRSAKTWADLVKNKDRHEFARRMTDLKKRLKKGNLDFRKAYENMYKIVEET
ncbi:prephenate dehydrogenase [Chloroflexota bacterium]